jgi:leucyl aminopeptidase
MFESISVGGKGKSEVLVLGVFQPSAVKDRPSLDRQTASMDPSGTATDALKRPEAGGETGSVIEAYVGKALKSGHSRVWILGLGKKENFKPDVLRTAMGNLGRRIAAAKVTSVDMALINVGKASENKPCMIRLEYKPKRGAAKNAKPIVLVGKTMTYDTGGLSLKINNGMVGMKRDKDGGCAVSARCTPSPRSSSRACRSSRSSPIAENSISTRPTAPTTCSPIATA